MRTHQCPYCHDNFTPSRYRPDQAVCSAPECQRQRRTAYHRRKLEDDALYREQCRESQRHWLEQHPDYMRSYRETRGKQPRNKRPATEVGAILDRIKNNVAGDLKAWDGRVYFVGANYGRNIVGSAEFLVIAGLAGKQRRTRA
jgi:hypothetical protein